MTSFISPDRVLSTGDPDQALELIDEIASGSFGKVYEGVVTETQQTCAIKIIELGDETLDDLLVEILIMKECNHPNIISYYGSWLKNDELYIAMELCSEPVSNCASLKPTEKQIAYICRESLKGLLYLHEKQIVHRDIKGQNVLLTDAGEIKLVDFGVSFYPHDPSKRPKTFIGTPYWMAPEVIDARGGEVIYDQRADVWSVGIMALELANGNPPLIEFQPMRALAIISLRDPPFLSNPSLWSGHFHDFIRKSLTKVPEQRPTTKELLEHPFLTQPLSPTLMQDLLSKLANEEEELLEFTDEDDSEKLVTLGDINDLSWLNEQSDTKSQPTSSLKKSQTNDSSDLFRDSDDEGNEEEEEYSSYEEDEEDDDDPFSPANISKLKSNAPTAFSHPSSQEQKAVNSPREPLPSELPTIKKTPSNTNTATHKMVSIDPAPTVFKPTTPRTSTDPPTPNIPTTPTTPSPRPTSTLTRPTGRSDSITKDEPLTIKKTKSNDELVDPSKTTKSAPVMSPIVVDNLKDKPVSPSLGHSPGTPTPGTPTSLAQVKSKIARPTRTKTEAVPVTTGAITVKKTSQIDLMKLVNDENQTKQDGQPSSTSVPVKVQDSSNPGTPTGQKPVASVLKRPTKKSSSNSVSAPPAEQLSPQPKKDDDTLPPSTQPATSTMSKKKKKKKKKTDTTRSEPRAETVKASPSLEKKTESFHTWEPPKLKKMKTRRNAKGVLATVKPSDRKILEHQLSSASTSSLSSTTGLQKQHSRMMTRREVVQKKSNDQLGHIIRPQMRELKLLQASVEKEHDQRKRKYQKEKDVFENASATALDTQLNKDQPAQLSALAKHHKNELEVLLRTQAKESKQSRKEVSEVEKELFSQLAVRHKAELKAFQSELQRRESEGQKQIKDKLKREKVFTPQQLKKIEKDQCFELQQKLEMEEFQFVFKQTTERLQIEPTVKLDGQKKLHRLDGEQLLAQQQLEQRQQSDRFELLNEQLKERHSKILELEQQRRDLLLKLTNGLQKISWAGLEKTQLLLYKHHIKLLDLDLRQKRKDWDNEKRQLLRQQAEDFKRLDKIYPGNRAKLKAMKAEEKEKFARELQLRDQQFVLKINADRDEDVNLLYEGQIRQRKLMRDAHFREQESVLALSQQRIREAVLLQNEQCLQLERQRREEELELLQQQHQSTMSWLESFQNVMDSILTQSHGAELQHVNTQKVESLREVQLKEVLVLQQQQLSEWHEEEKKERQGIEQEYKARLAQTEKSWQEKLDRVKRVQAEFLEALVSMQNTEMMSWKEQMLGVFTNFPMPKYSEAVR